MKEWFLLGLSNFVVKSCAANGRDYFQWGIYMVVGTPCACSVIPNITGVKCILPAVSSGVPEILR